MNKEDRAKLTMFISEITEDLDGLVEIVDSDHLHDYTTSIVVEGTLEEIEMNICAIRELLG